jgi:DNA-binding CsgD family transcriptional regulator
MPDVINNFDWKAVASHAGEALAPLERSIVELLAQDKGTYEIAKILKINRSAVWFKAKKIREKLPTQYVTKS